MRTDLHKSITFKAKLLSCLIYDSKRGIFIWNTGKRKGNQAGTVRICDGYRELQVLGIRALEHKLVWLMETGIYPVDRIYHKDGNKTNNVFSNLTSKCPPPKKKSKSKKPDAVSPAAKYDRIKLI